MPLLPVLGITWPTNNHAYSKPDCGCIWLIFTCSIWRLWLNKFNLMKYNIHTFSIATSCCEWLYSSVSTLPCPPRACSMCTMTGKLFPVLYSAPSDYSPCSILIPRLLVLFSLDVLHTLWMPHFYAEIQFIKRAYGKAGNGNEMKTRNRNWKWKLETELETKNAPIMGEVSSRTYE